MTCADSNSFPGSAVYTLLDAASSLLRKALPFNTYRRLSRWYTWAVDEPNALLQAAYLAVMNGGFGAALACAFPRVPCGTLAAHHKWFGVFGYAVCMASFVQACVAPPGRIIDAASVAKHDNYLFDGVLFVPGRICETAGVPKLARSKFDRVARSNVSRFDHFCPWLCAPIGEENYRWFLLFLLAHAAFLAYGAFACAQLLREVFIVEDLAGATFYNAATQQAAEASPLVIAQYLLSRDRAICALLLLCIVMSVVVAVFLAFHLWLVKCGMTTNEFYKWRDAASDRQRRGESPPPRGAERFYDLGSFAKNLHEVLMPRSLRPDALARATAAGADARRRAAPPPRDPQTGAPAGQPRKRRN
ncbi:DHHC palmitoyltransferase-domain-containing protein [Pelagophyceae sp. CCMP2097]|nr:DHHC palmitoyltransferase-domain-containing protein [Pelagophyceae sp. CCMP2097]